MSMRYRSRNRASYLPMVAGNSSTQINRPTSASCDPDSSIAQSGSERLLRSGRTRTLPRLTPPRRRPADHRGLLHAACRTTALRDHSSRCEAARDALSFLRSNRQKAIGVKRRYRRCDERLPSGATTGLRESLADCCTPITSSASATTHRLRGTTRAFIVDQPMSCPGGPPTVSLSVPCARDARAAPFGQPRTRSGPPGQRSAHRFTPPRKLLFENSCKTRQSLRPNSGAP